MPFKKVHFPDKIFLKQKAMYQVCYALIPVTIASIYLFGWRSLALMGVILLSGMAAEAVFTFRHGKPVSSAVFVTCMIYSLSLPPSIPFWMAVIGILIAVILGKMAFGGFGRNIFNPAMVGRCFIYITFPTQMTGSWVTPLWGGAGGFSYWTPSVDAVTGATPLAIFRSAQSVPFQELFIGNTSGSMGETSALLIILAGLYLLLTKVAPWRMMLSCVSGGILSSLILYLAGHDSAALKFLPLLSGGFLFGCIFVVTEPVTGPKTKPGQWIYGCLIGGICILLRDYSNFSEGFMFSVLLMNGFTPLMDRFINSIQTKKQAQG